MRPMRIQPQQYDGNGQYSKYMAYKQYNTIQYNTVLQLT